MRRPVFTLLAGYFFLMLSGLSRAKKQSPLVLEAKIPLGGVSDRIDHLAIDTARQRLFVAELGNDSLGVVDLAAGKSLRQITGLSEPQGVGYDAATDTVYVANASDGSVRLLAGDSLARLGRIDLGSDADNVRIDPHGQVVIGHSDGGLALINAAHRQKTAEIALHAHPESFQLGRERIFVNLPTAGIIGVIDGRHKSRSQAGECPAPTAISRWL
jgi:hypothetical protein